MVHWRRADAIVRKGARVRVAKAALKKAQSNDKGGRTAKASAKPQAGKPAPKPPPQAAKKAQLLPDGRPAIAAPKSATRRPVEAGAKPVNNQAPIAAPVPSNDKPRKNQAGFSARELEHFRDLLLAKRREILGDMSSMEREALRSSGGSNLSTLPIHMADMGTDNYEQEFTLGLVETERKLIREINNALAKIQNGTYGICEGTGKPITRARLEVQPWARYSIEYAKKIERGGR